MMATPSASLPLWQRAVVVLAGLSLALTLLGLLGGKVLSIDERFWFHAEAVVQNGHELAFTSADGEQHVLLGLVPPAGAPAWKDGDTVPLSYKLGRAQFAVLREREPMRWSEVFFAVGMGSFLPSLLLGLWAVHLQQLERRARPALAPRRPVDFLLWGLACLLQGAASLAALGVVLTLLKLVAVILYEPDPPGMVLASLLLALIFLGVALLCGLPARWLLRRDRQRRTLSPE